MNERLKLLRKTLGLSQEEFGKRIGVTKTSISRLESKVNNFTEQMILSICREFKVDYVWFVQGGQDEVKFDGVSEEILDELAKEFHLDEMDKRLFTEYLNLNNEQKTVIKDLVKILAKEESYEKSN